MTVPGMPSNPIMLTLAELGGMPYLRSLTVDQLRAHIAARAEMLRFINSQPPSSVKQTALAVRESDIAFYRQELAQRSVHTPAPVPASAFVPAATLLPSKASSSPPPLLFRPRVAALLNRMQASAPASEAPSQQSRDESRKRRAEEQAAPPLGYQPIKQPFS